MKNFKKLFIDFLRVVDRIISVLEWRFHSLYKKISRGKGKKRVIRDIVLILLTLFILGAALFLLWAASLKTPDLNSFDDRLLGQSAKIYDKTGTVLLYDLSQKVRRTVVPFDHISPYIKKATLAIEDVDFYTHGGIKASSIIRAIIANILSLHFSQGGSTITQQVVKNSLLTNSKDISRKLKEWILAVKLERTTDKDTILNLYFNQTPYGGNIYGVEEATKVYFGKSASEVTLAEAAYIAALPQAPTLYSPYGKGRQLLDDRKNLVLRRMLENNLITQADYDSAVKEVVIFQPKNIGGIKAPHFVMFVKDYLEQKYGSKMLESGGFDVITTLDWEMQQKMESVVKNYILTKGTTFKASNGAMVATDPRTGQILAMVGSRDYFDKDIDGNFNVATARRQPGSSFKPFVYATAFNEGYTPDTPVLDVATQFNASCSASNQPLSGTAKCYNPQNYEGGYKGVMSFRQALAQSRNIPAVKVLYLAGVNESIKTATRMGINNLGTANDYGLSLALGGAEVSPLDMTEAYGVFANNGIKPKVTGIIKITTSDGITVENFSTSTVEVLPRQTALQINDVLSDPFARSSIFGTKYFGDRQVAIKTGTTNSARDAWILGYTPSISVGAWMGNNNNTPMAQQASARIIGPMWKEFMDWELARLPDETFDEPTPIASSTKSFLRGVWQGPGSEIHSELYWVERDNPTGEVPGYNSNDSLFRLWETGVQNWASSQGLNLNPGTTITSTPSSAGFAITSPTPNAALNRNSRVNITVDGTSIDTSEVDYYINDVLLGKSTESPYAFSFIPASISGIQDEDELKAVQILKLGKYIETKINVSITQ